jgi:homoserine kinase
MYLQLRITITKQDPSQSPSRSAEQPQGGSAPSPTPPEPSYPSLNCSITYTGVSPSSIDLNPASNLLTRSSLYLLRCHGHHAFPHPTSIHIDNPIPLGRGLGSSGAAVVAGILLGNLALSTSTPYQSTPFQSTASALSLPKPRLLDYCLMIERHPDNVAAALYGGFVGTYLNELDPVDMARKEIPLSEVLPAPAGGVDTGLKPPEPPVDIGHFRRFRWAPEIKAVAVIPDFEVSTAKAREVLPSSYSRQDMVRCLPFPSSHTPSIPLPS